MSPIEPLQYHELDIEAIRKRLIEQLPAHKAHIAALEKLRNESRPTWKQMNDFVVVI